MPTTRIAALFVLPLLVSGQRMDWQPTFSEEFNGTELDLSRWIPRNPAVEAHSAAAGSFQVSGGQLHLTGPAALATFGLFAQPYGRFEIRCRFNAAPGTHTRFRLLPVPLSTLPAINVFDGGGDDSRQVFMGNFWGSPQTERSYGDSVSVPDTGAGFHAFAVEWRPGAISWLVDGKEKFKSAEGVPALPAWLLLETGGGTFDVDYIRVSRRP